MVDFQGFEAPPSVESFFFISYNSWASLSANLRGFTQYFRCKTDSQFIVVFWGASDEIQKAPENLIEFNLSGEWQAGNTTIESACVQLHG